MATLEQNIIGLGQRPALLVIDATTGFTNPASPLGTDGMSAVLNIEKIVQAFRANNYPIFFTVNAYEHEAEASVFRKKLPVLNLLAVDGPWSDIDPHLTVTESDYIFRKVVPSAFFDSPLRQLLNNLEIDSVVVCGFSTSGCVRATAVDALQSNFSVVIPSDACGDRDTEAHAYNLRDLGLKTGDVMSTEDLLKHVK
jgi:nicotinamidase-related amidase